MRKILASLLLAFASAAFGQATVTATSANAPTLDAGSGITGVLPPSNGGTGVANASTQTLTRSGAHALTITTSGTTNVTLPTSGTLAKTVSETFTTPNIGDATATSLTVNSYSAGTWTTPTFSAADYTSSSGTWVLTSGDVTTMKYTIINKTMTVCWYLVTTTVTGAPTNLNIKIPASKTAAVLTTGVHFRNQGTWATAAFQIPAAGTVISLHVAADFGGTAWAAGADNTYSNGCATFEIQ